MKVRRFSTVLARPWAWADHRMLRIERRFDGRAGQPKAMLFAEESGEVTPIVYFFRNRVHSTEPRREFAFKRMEYPDLDSLIADGWAPFSDEELDVPFGEDD